MTMLQFNGIVFLMKVVSIVLLYSWIYFSSSRRERLFYDGRVFTAAAILNIILMGIFSLIPLEVFGLWYIGCAIFQILITAIILMQGSEMAGIKVSE